MVPSLWKIRILHLPTVGDRFIIPLTNKESEAQRGKQTCLRTHSCLAEASCEHRWSGSRVLVHNCPRPLLLSAVIYLFIVFVYATFHPLPNTHLTFWKSEEGCTLCDLKAWKVICSQKEMLWAIERDLVLAMLTESNEGGNVENRSLLDPEGIMPPREAGCALRSSFPIRRPGPETCKYIKNSYDPESLPTCQHTGVALYANAKEPFKILTYHMGNWPWINLGESIPRKRFKGQTLKRCSDHLYEEKKKKTLISQCPEVGEDPYIS